MMALKAARAFTGRPKIAKCEGAYHGSYDYAEVSLETPPDQWRANEPPSTAYAAGTPQDVLSDVVAIPFNDSDAAADISAQVFIVLGDQVHRMQPWHIVNSITNGKQQWTVEQLIAHKDELFDGAPRGVAEWGGPPMLD